MASADTAKESVDKKITIDHDKCISCGTCLDVCPFMVYEAREYKEGSTRKRRIPEPVNLDDCVLCQTCQAQCPTGAITVEG